jgi:hypothetical protein
MVWRKERLWNVGVLHRGRYSYVIIVTYWVFPGNMAYAPCSVSIVT